VSTYDLTLVPSATMWLRGLATQPEPGARPLRVVALADPVISESVQAEYRLAPLPHARREGRVAVRRLGSPGGLQVGKEASEATVKSLPPGEVALLHFAAHAVIDGERPDRSAVLLAPGAGEDGLLQPHEIAQLQLDGAVVILSTCQSATGEVLAGEGPLSLARAFLQAGASTVVGSLWPLRDDETARLFDAFYRHLAAGKSVAESLAAAQRDRIEAGEPAAAWAGVVLLGDGGVTLPAPKPSRAVWLYLMVGIGVVALWVWVRSR
jgi:CHAT domain-containing protein